MEICCRMPSQTGSGGTYNAYGYHFNAKIYPIFADGLPKYVPKGIMETIPTGWTMHNSWQNNCHHAFTTDNWPYRFIEEQVYEASYPDLPIYNFHYSLGTFSRTIKGNYLFPFATTIQTLNSAFQTEVAPDPRRYDSFAVAVSIWEPTIKPGLYIYDCKLDLIVHGPKYGKDQYWFNAEEPGPHTTTRYLQIYRWDDKVSQKSFGEARCRVRRDPELRTIEILEVLSYTWYKVKDSECYPRSTAMLQTQIDWAPSDEPMRIDVDKAFDITYNWDEAVVAGLDQVNFFGSNGMAFAHDVASLPTTISSDISRLKSLTKVGKSGKLKIAASAFLSVHYGYKLLASDGIDLANELSQYSTDHVFHIGQSCTPSIGLRRKAEFSLNNANGHINVYYDPYGQLSTSIRKFAEAVDLVPDFSNIWDLIPFSFVVDWFTNVGELASGIDDFFTLTQQHKVLGTITSRKTSYIYQPSGYIGSALINRYDRTCSEGWYPIPKFSFQLKNPVTNLYHWLESLALVVATRP